MKTMNNPPAGQRASTPTLEDRNLAVALVRPFLAMQGLDALEAAENACQIIAEHRTAQHAALLSENGRLRAALQSIAHEAQEHHEYNHSSGVTRLPIGYTKILNLASAALTPSAPKEAT